MAPVDVSLQGEDVLVLAGEVDVLSVQFVREAGERLIDRCPQQFVVDLAGLASAHSVILSMLLRWMSYAKQQAKAFSIVNFPPKLFDVARVSGLEALLPFRHGQAAD